MEVTATPFKKKITPHRIGQTLTAEADFPADGSLVLGSARGTFTDVISGQERLTTLDSELDRRERKAGGGDLPKVTQGRESPGVWESSLPDLCSFCFAERVPDRRGEPERFSEWRW